MLCPSKPDKKSWTQRRPSASEALPAPCMAPAHGDKTQGHLSITSASQGCKSHSQSLCRVTYRFKFLPAWSPRECLKGAGNVGGPLCGTPMTFVRQSSWTGMENARHVRVRIDKSQPCGYNLSLPRQLVGLTWSITLRSEHP